VALYFSKAPREFALVEVNAMFRIAVIAIVFAASFTITAQSAPIILAEFKAKETAVRGGATPTTVPFGFAAYDSPLSYFRWDDEYGPSNVGTTFVAPPDVVAGAQEAIRSPTATFELKMALVKFATWKLNDPACDPNRCLQVFVPTTEIAEYTVTSVERIIDDLSITGDPSGGSQYGVVGTQRIRLWGEPPPPPPVYPPLTGDYNQNGTVDAADFVRWRHEITVNADLPLDQRPNLPNVFGDSRPASDIDYQVWRWHFGESVPPIGNGSLIDQAIPESRTITLLLITLFHCVASRNAGWGNLTRQMLNT
jgi:hypothetical protein